mgnify:CR=1 FL=1
MGALDFFILLLVFVSIVISVMVITSVFNPFVSELTKDSSNQYIQGIQQKYNDSEKSFDIMLLLIFFALMIGLVISVVLVPFHPIFLLALIILGMLVIFFAPFISNLFGAYITSEASSNIADKFPLTTLLFQNYPLILLGAVILVIIFSFNK